MQCTDCDKYEKGICGKVNSFEPRTTQTIKQFANAIEYLISLKENQPVLIDPFDLVFEAAKFTSYHGTLNVNTLNSKYNGDNQHMMNETLLYLKQELTALKHIIQTEIENKTKRKKFTEYLFFQKEGKQVQVEKNKRMLSLLKENNIPYTIQPNITFETLGIGKEWYKAFNTL
jgi:hypothetical protein